MDRKGFTLVELLGALVILGIIIALAGGVYTKVFENQKEHTYQNKVSTIEVAAEKWAEETNLGRTTTITVKRLVAESFYQADEYNEDTALMVVNDPRDDTSMLCNTIDVTIEDGVVKANFTGEKDCDLSDREEERAKVKIAAYEYDIVTRKVLKTLKERDDKNTILPWTRYAVLLVVEPTEEGYKDYTRVIYTNGAFSEEKSVNNNILSTSSLVGKTVEANLYANAYLVDTEVLLNTEYNIAIDLPKTSEQDKIYGIKSNDITVRIDKETPSLTYDFENEYTTTDKELTLKASDGAGSGLKTFYIYDVDGKLINKPDDFNAQENNNTMKITLKEGVYSVYAEDNVGNRNELPEIIKMINIVSNPPNCSFTLDRSPDYNGWYNKKVILTFKVTEPGSTGYNYYFGTSSIPTYSGGVASGFATTEINKSITLDTNKHVYYGYIKTSLGLTNACSIRVNVDTIVPKIPIITSSDNKESGKFHKDPFTLTASVSPENISGNIYYYGTTNNPTSTEKITVQEVSKENKKGQYWYAKTCSGSGLCSDVSSYMAKGLEINSGGFVKYEPLGAYCNLSYWRIIDVDEENETFEMMSVEACGNLKLRGFSGFNNSLDTLRDVAKTYESSLTTGSRYFGDTGKTSKPKNKKLDEWDSNNKDIKAANDVFGTLKAGNSKTYWVGMRRITKEPGWDIYDDHGNIIGFQECDRYDDHRLWIIKGNGLADGGTVNLYCDCDKKNREKTYAVRIIVKAKYSSILSGGDGSSLAEAFVLG